MLKIKLTRTGKRSQPNYRIVVMNDRSKLTGTYCDLLGTYNPLVNPPVFSLSQEKYAAWIKKGAQPTITIRQLVKKLITK